MPNTNSWRPSSVFNFGDGNEALGTGWSVWTDGIDSTKDVGIDGTDGGAGWTDVIDGIDDGAEAGTDGTESSSLFSMVAIFDLME